MEVESPRVDVPAKLCARAAEHEVPLPLEDERLTRHVVAVHRSGDRVMRRDEHRADEREASDQNVERRQLDRRPDGARLRGNDIVLGAR